MTNKKIKIIFFNINKRQSFFYLLCNKTPFYNLNNKIINLFKINLLLASLLWTLVIKLVLQHYLSRYKCINVNPRIKKACCFENRASNGYYYLCLERLVIPFYSYVHPWANSASFWRWVSNAHLNGKCTILQSCWPTLRLTLQNNRRFPW